MTTARASVPNPPPVPPGAAGSGGASDIDGMPRRFGKYTLMRKLATGGMAELFLALQRSVAGFEKLIVVKRVLPNLAQDRSFIELLLTEARIAATLNHPNVAHIYDVGEVEGQFYIAMEHIHGEDLRSIVRQMKKVGVTAFPLEHALAIVLGCCAGLAYAHEKRDLDGEPMNIVHRDVSPQNILVTFTGDVKLVDFGIAKAGRSHMEDTGSGQLKGKVPYMSPEQAQGLPLDGRSDIFSLGIMLFELCTGKRLFRGASEMDTLKMIVEGQYPRPRALNPNLHPKLEQIILRSLEKDPGRRYQSARDMQAELEDYIRENQLKVSPLSLAAWMQQLFGEKLQQQRQMLQEGRQLAEVIAAQAAAEEEARHSHEGTSSGVRTKQPSRAPWIVMAMMGLVAAVGAVWFAMTQGASSAPTGPGVLALSSTPPGAAILIDGSRREERTPATIEHLPLGRYAVTITADGFAPFRQEVELTESAARAEIAATLERPSASAMGVARIETTPPGARILLDGADTDLVSPATVSGIEPGVQHTIVVSLDGWVTQTAPVMVSAGAVQEVRLTLERTPLAATEHLVTITTDPPEARVQLDTEWHSGGSPYVLRVPARRYRLRVARDGFRTHEREIALAGGEQSELRIDLERERRAAGGGGGGGGGGEAAAAGGPGNVTIDARPWCNVTLDGRPLGQTPIVNRSVASGRHTVVCTNPDSGQSRTMQIDVHPGQTTRTRITL
ncbi:serine/threonine-protein kinase [Sandaracinus amylolyticus]|nr:serine/threonine-protein kinase [Sandaracinus amylolyticus]